MRKILVLVQLGEGGRIIRFFAFMIRFDLQMNNIFEQHFTHAYLSHPRQLTINQHVTKGPDLQTGRP